MGVWGIIAFIYYDAEFACVIILLKVLSNII